MKIKIIIITIISIINASMLLSEEKRKIFDDDFSYFKENRNIFIDNKDIYYILNTIYSTIKKSNQDSIKKSDRNVFIYTDELNRIKLEVYNDAGYYKGAHDYFCYKFIKILQDDICIYSVYCVYAELNQPDLITFNYKNEHKIIENIFYSNGKKKYEEIIYQVGITGDREIISEKILNW